ncbi:MAG: hypothetical protein O3A65_01855 [Proteobacteria bacterium]|nr:hypothetical protein [Pseudomonadota bacterium]
MTQVQIKIITLFVVGILLGPAYHFYCLAFSGEVLSTVMLNQKSDRWILNDGSIFRITRGLSYQPIEIPLSPADNVLLVKISCAPVRCGQLNGFTLSLSTGTAFLFNENIKVNSLWPFSALSLGPISIPYPEKFMLLIESISNTRESPPLALSIKKNVTSPSYLLLCIGYGLTLLPVILLFRTFRKK